jgi:Alpha galactosidase A
MSQWTAFSGPGSWPDPDSLEIGNGPLDGINSNGSNFTQNQRQTLFSWWCVTAAPLILGTDLTSNIDSYDYSLLHNSEVIAVNQAGVQAAPVVDYLTSDPGGSQPETWRAKEADNSFTVLVSNPSGNTQTGTTAWSLFGIPGPVRRDSLGADSVSLRFAGIGKGESQFFEGNDSEFPFDQREPQRFHGRRSGQREPGLRSRLEYGHDFVEL